MQGAIRRWRLRGVISAFCGRINPTSVRLHRSPEGIGQFSRPREELIVAWPSIKNAVADAASAHIYWLVDQTSRNGASVDAPLTVLTLRWVLLL